jgi:hypothetical protein
MAIIPTYVVVALDVLRDVRVKSIVCAWSESGAMLHFHERFPPERFMLEETREITEFELNHPFDDGSTLREIVDICELGEIPWTTDLA